jgi:hypothetical protein
MFCDMKELTIEELVGRRRAAEDSFKPTVEQVTDKAGRLLLMEEDWVARNKSRPAPDSSSGSGNKGGGCNIKKEQSEARGGGEARDSGVKHTLMGTPRRKGKCRKCGIYGHFAKECKSKVQNEERQEAAHHANTDAEPVLMMAQVCNVVWTATPSTQRVFLNQERVFLVEYGEGAWVLDTGATNHMTGCQESLATLDELVRGTVRFGDGSTVEIHGIGAVTIAGKNQDHRVLIEVYFIPSLKSNILSLGHLEEGGAASK